MNVNFSFNGRTQRGGSKIYLAALAIAMEPNATEERKRQIARSVLCEFCRAGMPVENGMHNILGAEVRCDAESVPDPDQPVIDALHQLRDVTAEYDPALLAARRAAFVKQIEAQNDDHEWQAPSIKDQLDSAGFGHSGQF